MVLGGVLMFWFFSVVMGRSGVVFRGLVDGVALDAGCGTVNRELAECGSICLERAWRRAHRPGDRARAEIRDAAVIHYRTNHLGCGPGVARGPWVASFVIDKAASHMLLSGTGPSFCSTLNPQPSTFRISKIPTPPPRSCAAAYAHRPEDTDSQVQTASSLTFIPHQLPP